MPPKPNLDVLRAFAVTLVVIEHTLLALNVFHVGAWTIAWMGVAGVMIFFVHTSLVLMWSLERKPYMLDFYIRRVFRIYPLTIVAVLAAVLSRAPVNGTAMHIFQYVPITTKNIVLTSLMVQNLFANQSNIVGVLWSLPLEVQMYVLLPFLFFAIRKERALWPILLLWGFAAATARIATSPDGIDFLNAIPDFIPGVMAYVLFARRRPILPAWTLAPCLLLLLGFYMQHPSPRRGWPFCLLLGLLLPFFRQFASAWITRPAHEIAKYSFGIYLAHPFSIVLGIYLLRGHSLALQIAVELVSIVLFAVLGYHLVEHPFIRLGSRLAARAERLYEKEEAAAVWQQPSPQA